jgi:lysophospholipase L1-like esterase
MIKKVFVVLISILTFLILSEISLRIFGYFYRPKSENSKISNENYTILAIGDSFTYGIGAPDGKDYPSQLEDILNLKTNKKFKVINRGVLGQNSSEAYKNLKNQLTVYKPGLVIVLIGGANARNYWGFGSSINKLLYRTRVYKLIELLYLNVKQKKINAETEKQNWMNSIREELNGASVKISKTEDRSSIVFKNAFEQNKKRISKQVKTGADYYDIGTFYIREKKFNEAIKWFGEGINSFPAYMKNYEGITYTYILHNKAPDAEKWLLSGLAKNEKSVYLHSILGLVNIIDTNYTESLKWLEKGVNFDDKSLECSFNLTLLRRFYVNYVKQNPSYSQKVNIFDQLDSLIRKYPFDYTYFDSLDSKLKFYNYSNTYYYTLKNMKKNNYMKVKNWVYNDVQKIVDLCRSFNAKIIIQNYPTPVNATDFQYIANGILKEISIKNNIPFVNNAGKFNSLGEQKQSFFQSVYEGDHPNEKGYGLMAKDLFEKIIETKVFNVDTILHGRGKLLH